MDRLFLTYLDVDKGGVKVVSINFFFSNDLTL